MKIRMRANSLRLRLSQPEVRKIASGDAVCENVSFGPEAVFRYALSPRADAEAVEARLLPAEIAVFLPLQVAREWALSADVSLTFVQPSGLHLLIEKDFACLKPRANFEDESELFANPNTTCGADPNV